MQNSDYIKEDKTSDEILTTIGARIKIFRLKMNMTQNKLAGECDFQKASMSRIESGKINVTIRTLYKISQVLNINISELVS